VGSDIEFICHRAAMLAIRKFINQKTKNTKLEISKQHFEDAIELLHAQKG